MKVDRWICYDEAEDLPSSGLGGLGGFFKEGMRWQDYLDAFEAPPEFYEYAEAFRAEVLKRELKRGGDWHQDDDGGAPVFDDGTAAHFSYRAWGDIMAAIWAEHDDTDYDYMDFYMNGNGRVLGHLQLIE